MEEEIAVLEKTVKQLEAQLADDKLYNDTANANKVTDNYQLKKLELNELQVKWETLAGQIMELEA